MDAEFLQDLEDLWRLVNNFLEAVVLHLHGVAEVFLHEHREHLGEVECAAAREHILAVLHFGDAGDGFDEGADVHPVGLLACLVASIVALGHDHHLEPNI